MFPQAKLESTAVEGASELGPSVKVKAKLSVPKLAQLHGTVLRLPALGIQHEVTRTLAPLTERKHPVRPEEPRTQIFNVELSAPSGWRFAQVPADKSFRTPFGRFMLKIRSTGSTASVECHIEYTGQDIPVVNYPAYREFLRSIDLSLAQTFELVSQTAILP